MCLGPTFPGVAFKKEYQTETVTIHLTANVLHFIFISFEESKIFFSKMQTSLGKKRKSGRVGEGGGENFFCLRRQKKRHGNGGAPTSKVRASQLVWKFGKAAFFPCAEPEAPEATARQEDTIFI